MLLLFFFSSRRRHTRWTGDWSSDVCSSDLFYKWLDTQGSDVGSIKRLTPRSTYPLFRVSTQSARKSRGPARRLGWRPLVFPGGAPPKIAGQIREKRILSALL